MRFAFLFRAAGGRSAPESGGRLGAMRRKLEDVSRSTERDFVEVGRRLEDFAARIKAMSGEAREVADRLSGGHGTSDAAQRLREILEQAQHIRSTKSRDEELQAIFEAAHKLRGPLSRLHEMSRSFQVLAIMTRVEDARLDAGTGFAMLADEVRLLATDIQSKSDQVLAACGELAGLVAERMAKISALQTKQKAELPGIIAEATAGLEALEAKRAHAAQVTSRIAARYEQASGAVFELVTSLQFHDIVRQQMEHASAALADAESGSGIGRIAGLQAAQLRQARSTLTSATAGIIASLATIVSNTAEIARETEELLKAQQGEGVKSLDDMHHGFAGIAATLGSCSEAGSAMVEAERSVASAVERMRVSLGEIEMMGFRLQRIALNAEIKAAQIGAAGAAVGALAEGIQRLAAAASSETATIATAVQALSSAGEELSRHSGEEASAAAVEPITSKMETSVCGLREAADDVLKRFARIKNLGQEVSEEIATVSQSLTAHESAAAAMDDLARELDAAARNAGSAPGDREELRAIRERYTMNSERAVHETVLAGAGAAVSESAADTGEFGGNVELF